MAVWVVIPAAGMGRRMGSETSKQFLQLGGRPILAHTLDLFERHSAIDHLVLVVPAREQELCRQQVVGPGGYRKLRAMVDGGVERQDSVRLGLRACLAADDDLVLIHDGVRPLFDAALIEPLLAAARETGGAIVGVPVKDTVKVVEDSLIAGTPRRDRLWLAQTPQAFPFAVIREAHERALADGHVGTDDASLVERLGRPVAVVRGDYRNIKITTPEDLILAEALLAAQEVDR
ncbi:2-C-methyl-D-erythritol 4-phosphate cytidylyltransferase [Geothermobacter ehrlichii]|uniref:2-C-methyl-D-erythritol 4-phosphate cytidylyltransferase n=1 Tax=Geothermobacter ehrlichii TaxID=213224 RepID=A0A5D3WH07_9BACT|nr:2-C-methyl-D-erythritol 4-phosphate cytidylyltransferase [Geothermobacter ehrlichii]TYO96825.1 2-C-methyl-D-erythritol 4-phosphate cytidylyltransferase [Geothermobacter ehrlichii]